MPISHEAVHVGGPFRGADVPCSLTQCLQNSYEAVRMSGPFREAALSLQLPLVHSLYEAVHACGPFCGVTLSLQFDKIFAEPL